MGGESLGRVDFEGPSAGCDRTGAMRGAGMAASRTGRQTAGAGRKGGAPAQPGPGGRGGGVGLSRTAKRRMTRDLPRELWRAAPIYAGTNEIMKEIIGRGMGL